MRKRSVWVLIAALGVCAYPVFAGGFLIQVQLPDRTDPAMKDALIVVKPVGCHGPGSTVAATAEGLVNGQRKTVEVKLTKLPRSSGEVYETYTVKRQWPVQGAWVLVVTADNPIVIKGKTQPMSTSAIVEFDSAGRPRMTGGIQPRQLLVKHFGKITAADVDSALQSALSKHGRQSATL